MQYRHLPRGGEKIGVIGMGSAVVGAQAEKDIINTVRCAYENGVNLFDMAGGHASIFPAYGKALKGIRENVFLQVHFGANYTTGEYGWTTNLEEVKKAVAWQLKNLQTDYIDFGFIHCLDEESDYTAYVENGVMDYLLQQKEKGIVRHIGLSSHTPALVNQALDAGNIDLVMFSINPLYDWGKGEYGRGEKDERQALYARCEREGVGISVMKPYCGGQLLDAAKSPYKTAFTKNQLIRYALDTPAVVSVLPGCANVSELMDTLSYFNATEAEKDISAIAQYTPADEKVQCVYCRHCHPCPAGLDIALINKYYDLARLGDVLAKQHYLTLEKTAKDCVSCGHCEKRCPFHTQPMARMKEIQAYFGENE